MFALMTASRRQWVPDRTPGLKRGRRTRALPLACAAAFPLVGAGLASGTVVTLTAGDANSATSTSFNSAGNWNNGAAPSSGNTYFTSTFAIRSPNNSGNSYTFGGDSLSIDTGGRFLMKSTGTQSLTVNLVLNGGYADQANSTGDTDAVTLNGTLAVNANSGLGALGTETLTINSTLSGGSNLQIGGSTLNAGGDTSIVYFTGANTAYTGTTTIGSAASGAILSVSSDANLGAPTNGLTFAGGTLQVTGTSLKSLGSHVVTFASGAPVTLDINTAGNTFTLGQPLNQGSGTFTKVGAGTLALTGANTYTGTTTISAGSLLANNASGSATGSGAVNVTTGILGGTGTISLGTGNAVSVAAAGALAPGSPSLTGDALTVSGGSGVNFSSSTSKFAVKTGATGVSDLLSVTGGGNLALASNVLSLTSTSTGVFVIASDAPTGTLSGFFGQVLLNGTSEGTGMLTSSAGNTTVYTYPNLTLTYTEGSGLGGNVSLAITSLVPEPASLGLFAAAGLGLLARRRRRLR